MCESARRPPAPHRQRLAGRQQGRLGGRGLPGLQRHRDRVSRSACQLGRSAGYKFVTRDRTIVDLGDTRPSEAVVDACNGCDVLVHEVYSAEKFLEQKPEWRAYHANAHTSTTELAELATRARPKLLVLYHQLYWAATDDDLLREVRKGYAGAVVSARDLGIY